jgi:hypothetical protein
VRYVLPAFGWIVVAVLGAAAIWAAALSFGAGRIGPVSGEGVHGDDGVVLAAALAMLLGAVLELAYVFRPHVVAALLAPAAAAFLLAFFFNYDPYYAPTLRRYSDGGLVSGGWIAFLALSALGAAVLSRFRPPGGAAVSAVVLLLVLGTTVVVPAGH